MQQIFYDGQPAAMAGPERFWLVDELAALADEDPVRVWVSGLCVYAGRVLTGQLPGQWSRPWPSASPEKFSCPKTSLEAGGSRGPQFQGVPDEVAR
jgi:hypothetical protein